MAGGTRIGPPIGGERDGRERTEPSIHVSDIAAAGAPAAALDIAELAPGVVFTTEVERFLILRELGEGGTARACVALPLRTAQFAGLTFPPLPPMDTIGAHPMLPADHRLLTEYEDSGMACCLKVFALPPEDPLYGPFLERLRQEVEFLARVGRKSRQFPYLLAAGETPIPWIAIELIRGETLADLIQRYHGIEPPRRMEWRRANAITGKLAVALDALHGAGIIHRDLKPHNVVMEHPTGSLDVMTAATRYDDEYPRVIDLGIGKAVRRSMVGPITAPPLQDRGITRFMPGVAMLTPGYGAPEQAYERAAVTPATDVYALAAMAYELFTGALPYGSPLDTAEYLAITREPLPPFTHPVLSRDCCTQLHYVFARALAFDARERYQRATEFADALRAVLEAEERRARARAPDSAARANGGARKTPARVSSPGRTPVTSARRMHPPVSIWQRLRDFFRNP